MLDTTTSDDHCISYVEGYGKSKTRNESCGEPYLLKKDGWKIVHRMLCNISVDGGRGEYTKFSCSACQRGFNVNCLPSFHNSNCLRYTRPKLYSDIERTKGSFAMQIAETDSKKFLQH